MQYNTALFTGSFDPFHVAHAWQIKRAYNAQPFEHVIIAILEVNPDKPFLQPIKHRLKIAKLTLESMDLAFTWELISIPDNYPITLQTVVESSHDVSNVLRILGADSYIEFLESTEKQSVLAMFKTIVVERPVVRKSEVLEALSSLPATMQKTLAPITIVEIDQVEDISARNFRQDMKTAHASGLVCDSAYQYMIDNGLYRTNK